MTDYDPILDAEEEGDFIRNVALLEAARKEMPRALRHMTGPYYRLMVAQAREQKCGQLGFLPRLFARAIGGMR